MLRPMSVNAAATLVATALGLVPLAAQAKVGVIDRSGKYVIPPKYALIVFDSYQGLYRCFKNQPAPASSSAVIDNALSETNHWNFEVPNDPLGEWRDRDNKLIANDDPRLKNHPDRSMAHLEKHPKEFPEGLGAFIISVVADSTKGASDDTTDFRAGFMNKDQKVVIPAKYGWAGNFNGGSAPVMPVIDLKSTNAQPKAFYINKAEKVVSPTFAYASEFHGPLAVVAFPPKGHNEKAQALDEYILPGHGERSARAKHSVGNRVLVNRQYKAVSKEYDSIDYLKIGLYAAFPKDVSPVAILDLNGKLKFTIPNAYRKLAPLANKSLVLADNRHDPPNASPPPIVLTLDGEIINTLPRHSAIVHQTADSVTYVVDPPGKRLWPSLAQTLVFADGNGGTKKVIDCAYYSEWGADEEVTVVQEDKPGTTLNPRIYHRPGTSATTVQAREGIVDTKGNFVVPMSDALFESVEANRFLKKTFD